MVATAQRLSGTKAIELCISENMIKNLQTIRIEEIQCGWMSP